MIFRITQKLSAKIKAGPTATVQLDANPFADWSAAVFQVGRTQYLLLTNTTSLYSTVIPGKGITRNRYETASPNYSNWLRCLRFMKWFRSVEAWTLTRHRLNG